MKYFFSLILLLAVLTGRSQTGYYITYDDYISGNLQNMRDIDDFAIGALPSRIFFINPEGKIQKVFGKNMWGFILKGNLFRCIGRDVAKVVDSGKVVYYESGVAHLKMILFNTDKAVFYDGWAFYMSRTLNDKCFFSLEKFFKKNVDFIPLKFCLKTEAPLAYKVGTAGYERLTSEGLAQIRNCVRKFNLQ